MLRTTTPRVLLTAALPALVATMAVTPTPGHAQPGTWIGGDGNWADAANWFGADVPDTDTEDASITNGSDVTNTANFTIGGLTLGASDTLTLPTLGRLNLNGNLVNDGVFTLDGVNSVSALNTETDTVFSGSGEIVIGTLGVNTGVNSIGKFTGDPSVMITNANTHTIRATGPGLIGRSQTVLHNAGLIAADGAAAEFVIQPIASSTFVNTGTLRAMDNGLLRFSNGGTVTIDNTGGLIDTATGGSIELFNTRITGGTLNGDLQLVTTGMSITDLTNTGTLTVRTGVNLRTNGTILNHGTINLTGGGFGAFLGPETDTVLTGTGEVIFTGTNLSRITSGDGSGQTITNSAGHTLRAITRGDIGANLLTVNNAGLILADGATADLTLQALAGSSFNNTGTIRADAGLITLANTVDNTGGVIETVNGGTIELQQVNLIGGSLNGNIDHSVASTIRDLTNNTTLTVADATFLATAGTIVNNGTIDIASTGGSTSLRLVDDTVLTGPGELIMSTSGPNFISADVFGRTLTNAAGHTLRVTGVGNIGSNVAGVANEGLILADGASLTVDTDGVLDNDGGTFRAINGSTVILDSGSGIATSNGGTLEVVNASVQPTGGNPGIALTVGADANIRVVSGTLRGFDNTASDNDLAASTANLEFRSATTDLFRNTFPTTTGSVGVPTNGLSTANDLRSDAFAGSGGTFRLGDNTSFRTAPGVIGGATEFLNTGTIVAETGSTFMAGSVVDMNSAGNGSGGIDWRLDGEGPLRNTGTLAGTGTIHAGVFLTILPNSNSSYLDNAVNSSNNAASLINEGTIAPGDHPGDTGTLTLRADKELVLAAAGLLELEIGGTAAGDFDTVDVITGSQAITTDLALGGGLDLALMNSFNPGTGDTFDILTKPAGGVTGTFDGAANASRVGVRGTAGSFLISYLSDTVRLSSFLSGVTGDYNGSGQVEQADLDLVLQNWGVDTSATTGVGIPTGWVNDLPVGQIEQTELDGVLQNWGNTAAPDFRGTSVPEPAWATLALVLFGARRLRSTG